MTVSTTRTFTRCTRQRSCVLLRPISRRTGDKLFQHASTSVFWRHFYIRHADSASAAARRPSYYTQVIYNTPAWRRLDPNGLHDGTSSKTNSRSFWLVELKRCAICHDGTSAKFWQVGSRSAKFWHVRSWQVVNFSVKIWQNLTSMSFWACVSLSIFDEWWLEPITLIVRNGWIKPVMIELYIFALQLAKQKISYPNFSLGVLFMSQNFSFYRIPSNGWTKTYDDNGDGSDFWFRNREKFH